MIVDVTVLVAVIAAPFAAAAAVLWILETVQDRRQMAAGRTVLQHANRIGTNNE